MIINFDIPKNPVVEVRELSIYVAGFAAGKGDKKLSDAAKWLEKLSTNICAQGYIGCSGGAICTSDHK